MISKDKVYYWKHLKVTKFQINKIIIFNLLSLIKSKLFDILKINLQKEESKLI